MSQPILKQPNRWSCLPTAFAKAFNVDYDVLITLIGQNPDLVIRSDLDPSDPRARRSVAINEIVRVGLMLGYAATPIIPELIVDHNPTAYKISDIDDILDCTSGVIMCTPKIPAKVFSHAVYWNGTLVEDPNGTIYPLADLLISYTIDAYWVVKCIVQRVH